jgi:hypothetical protein
VARVQFIGDRKAKVTMLGKELNAKLVDMPSLMEVYRSLDPEPDGGNMKREGKSESKFKDMYHKTADMTQMLIVQPSRPLAQPVGQEKDKVEPVDPSLLADPPNEFPHGLTGATYNVRKRLYEPQNAAFMNPRDAERIEKIVQKAGKPGEAITEYELVEIEVTDSEADEEEGAGEEEEEEKIEKASNKGSKYLGGRTSKRKTTPLNEEEEEAEYDEEEGDEEEDDGSDDEEEDEDEDEEASKIHPSHSIRSTKSSQSSPGSFYGVLRQTPEVPIRAADSPFMANLSSPRIGVLGTGARSTGLQSTPAFLSPADLVNPDNPLSSVDPPDSFNTPAFSQSFSPSYLDNTTPLKADFTIDHSPSPSRILATPRASPPEIVSSEPAAHPHAQEIAKLDADIRMYEEQLKKGPKAMEKVLKKKIAEAKSNRDKLR